MPQCRHATARFDGARGMNILTFQQRVVDAHKTVFEELESGAPRSLVDHTQIEELAAPRRRFGNWTFGLARKP